MLGVSLKYCTRTSRLLARVVAKAVNDLADRTRTMPFAPRDPYEIHGKPDTLDAVGACDEVNGGGVPERPQRIFGLTVVVDLDVPPDQIWIVEPRSMLNEPIEVL